MIKASFFSLTLSVFLGCVSAKAPVPTAVIQTTDGPIPAATAGVILPHEHIFTDLRGPKTSGYGQADVEDVVRIMKPLLLEAKKQGVDVMVECTTIGVGRNVPVIARLARETGLRIVVPTGVYGRAEFAPEAYRQMSESELVTWMVKEIRQGIDGTGVKAGFIKIASSSEALNPLEEKFCRTAARAARETGVVVASHTTSGAVAVQQAEILQQEGLPLDRFIWVHAQAEKDGTYYERLAARGAFIEFDSVGANPADDPQLIAAIRGLIVAGQAHRILLSHDAGWYNPGQPNGGSQRPYTYLLEKFVPKLRISGLGEETIRQLLSKNPSEAFGIKQSR